MASDDLTFQEAADVLEVSEGLLRELVAAGAVVTSGDGLECIPRADVLSLRARRERRRVALDEFVAAVDQAGFDL